MTKPTLAVRIARLELEFPSGTTNLAADVRNLIASHKALAEALTKARPIVNLHCTKEQAEASSRWYAKAKAALEAIDAALQAAGEK